MKGIYLLIRTEKLSLCQTRTSPANVQSILFKRTEVPRGPVQIMSRLIIWITRYFWFIMSALLLLRHLLPINTWHDILAERNVDEWNRLTYYLHLMCMVNIAVTLHLFISGTLLFYKKPVFKCVCFAQFSVGLVFTAGFCYGPFYPPARHNPGKAQLGFQPVWYQ